MNESSDRARLAGDSDMKRNRHTPKQVVRKLKTAEQLIGPREGRRRRLSGNSDRPAEPPTSSVLLPDLLTSQLWQWVALFVALPPNRP